MACFNCTESEIERLERVESEKVERKLKEFEKEESNQIKLLLLGIGASGKSTFIRQMQIMYYKGFRNDERQSYIEIIFHNVLTSLKALVTAMDTLNIQYGNDRNATNSKLIMDLEEEEFLQFPDMFVASIEELWDDAGVQQCFRRRNEYQITDSIKYYIRHIERISGPNYLPTDDDILHVRAPTQGLVEYKFEEKNADFRIIDVGGQRGQRLKWLRAFDGVKVVLFVVAISEYDQVLEESDDRNRLIESKLVFDQIVNCGYFSDSSLIVFFNKIDLLEEKIIYSDLAHTFPEFTGEKRNADVAKKFIRDMFLKQQKKRNLYHHYTCATDTGNFKVVFKVVRETILQHYLRATHID